VYTEDDPIRVETSVFWF